VLIVDFENNPKNSIIYSTSIVLSYLKRTSGKADFDELYQHCKDFKMEYSIFILSIDWMYLVGIISEINEQNEVVLCAY